MRSVHTITYSVTETNGHRLNLLHDVSSWTLNLTALKPVATHSR